MSPADTGKNLLWILLSTCLIIFIVMLEIFTPKTGVMILLSYLAFALLYISGHYKILMAGLAVTVTALIIVFILAGDSLGVFTGPVPFLIFALWTVILGFTLEYIFVSGRHGLETAPMYRQYLLLNMVQCLNLLFSVAMLAFAPHLLKRVPAPEPALLDACTLSVILFFVSFMLFISFFLKQALSADFMRDFARAVYDIGRDGEYEDRKQGIKDGSPKQDFLRINRRMRLITYLLFAASLAALFMIHKSRVIDAYTAAVAGRNAVIDGIIYLLKNPPRAVTGILKVVFLVMNILIIRDFLKMPFVTKLLKWLKGSNEPAKDQ